MRATNYIHFRFGAKLIVWNEIDPGTVFVVLMAVMSGSMSLGNMAPQIAVLASAKGAAGVIFDIIDNVRKFYCAGCYCIGWVHTVLQFNFLETEHRFVFNGGDQIRSTSRVD